MRSRASLFALVLLAGSLCFGLRPAASSVSTPTVAINEFLADNDGVIADEFGEFDDVLELYNAGSDDVDLQGMYLTDKLAEPTKFQIVNSIVIPSGGYAYFWADSQPEQGIYHTNFSLSKSGEAIGLFAADGLTPVDTYTFGPQATDVSEGRCPDGGVTWLFYTAPTIGATNEPCGAPPSITGTVHAPEYPRAGEDVTVSATITDDGMLVAATLWYSVSTEYEAVPMAAQGGSLYAGVIPGQPDSTKVRYYVEAEDDAGQTATDPTGAPVETYGYVAGYEPPGLVYLPWVGRAIGFTAPSLPLRLDCGSDDPYTTVDGTTYLPDRAWDPGAAYGYLGGIQDLPSDWWEGNPVGGTADAMLYKTQRIGWQEYRVGRIPNGPYLLTLRFEEQQVHGPGFSVVDVVAEGETLLHDLDVYAEAGRYYVLNLRLAVMVTDGELNLTTLPYTGEASLGALELIPRQPDSAAPAVPAGLEATTSYGAVLLDWAESSEDDAAGYQVYRANYPGGPYVRLTVDGPDYLSRYQDNVAAHVTHYYRVSAVDAYGNESAPCDYISAASVDVSEATLPLYRLEVSPENLHILEADPFLDTRVPGTFTWQGKTLDVEVRFRGNLGRTVDKKSWKIVFDPAESPFPNHDRINVNANWLYMSIMHAKLATGLFDAAGLHPPEAEMVLLTLNGDYRGVFTRNEQVDEGFLASSGRSQGASVYKVVDSFGEVFADEQAYRLHYEKETNENLPWGDLISFIELINYTPDDQFASALLQVMDVEAFLDHYAVIVLTANNDSATRNIYLVHDLDTNMWELVPWDLDWGFSLIEAPIDLGTLEHPDQTGRGSILRSRVLAVPEFRDYYCDRLVEYMGTLFSGPVLKPQVTALHSAIEADGVRDWWKLGWEDSTEFQNSVGYIKNFITSRAGFLAAEMQSFCPARAGDDGRRATTLVPVSP
jgi:spore coat protein CotH